MNRRRGHHEARRLTTGLLRPVASKDDLAPSYRPSARQGRMAGQRLTGKAEPIITADVGRATCRPVIRDDPELVA